jgi:predicted small lipoprotein YifL
MRPRRILLSLLLVLPAACGMYGPLYLPGEEPGDPATPPIEEQPATGGAASGLPELTPQPPPVPKRDDDEDDSASGP